MTLRTSTLRAGILAIGLTGFLAACDTAEERAQAFYNKGQELIAAGEIDKAILEFRNALQLNQDAVPPRLAFAKALIEKQDYQNAVGNLLRVVELDGANIEARRLVGQILIGAGQVEQGMVHVNAAFELDPRDAEVRGLKATGEFRLGNVDEAVRLSKELLAEQPNSLPAYMVLIGERVQQKDFAEALRLTDEARDRNPSELGLHLTRLSILEQQGDLAGVGAQLKEMRRLFPANKSIGTSLVRWYITQGELESAETELRALSDALPEDREAALDIFRFLRQYRSEAAARDELVKRTQDGARDRAFFLRVLSSYDFQQGDAQGAIQRLRELLATDLDQFEANETKMTLADILRRTGETTEAATLFNEVLEVDPQNVNGLRLRALNALDQDRAEDAITDLRAALNQDPENAQLMTILATAHERNGSPGLALERLALAMKASDYGIEEIQRYAGFLVKEGQVENAETVLRDGLRRKPDTPELMAALARIRLQQQDWKGAEEMAVRLDAIGTEEARSTARNIRVAAASGQENFDQSIGLLRDMWAESGEATTAMENLVRTYVQTGEANKAVIFLQDILSEDPKNMRAMLLLGAVRATQGETDMAEELYRKVIENHPNAENGYTALSALLQRLGRNDEADEIRKEGLAQAPDSARLLLSQAARLEVGAKFDEAIAIYETLYERNPNSDLVANNLASLLSEHRKDGESQERAFNVAKRLRASEIPAFQDTYGWILYNRGDYERALVALRKAYEGLGNNALVNYHIGMTYKELGQVEDARRHLSTAVELGRGSNLPQITAAQRALDEIGAQ